MIKSKKSITKEKNVEKVSSMRNILYEDLEGKFLHIKVGDDQRPADAQEVLEIQKKIVNLFENNNVNCLVFVTHHAVEVNLIERDKKIISEKNV